MDHKYYIDSICNRHRPSMFNDDIRQSTVDYGKDVRVFVINDEGAIVDKNDHRDDDDVNANAGGGAGGGSREVGLGEMREVEMVEVANEAMARAVKQRDNRLGDTDNFSKVAFGNVMDNRAEIRKILERKVGTGGARLFIFSLALFCIFQISSLIAYWTFFDQYSQYTKSYVGIIQKISQLETHLSRLSFLGLIVGMSNRGVSFPPTLNSAGASISMAERSAAYAEELKLAIEDVQSINKEMSNSLYTVSEVQNLWIEGSSVEMLNGDGSIEEKVSIANGLSAVTGVALALKNGNLRDFNLAKKEELYVIRNSVGSLYSLISQTQNTLNKRAIENNATQNRSMMIFGILQLTLGILLSIGVFLAAIRVHLKQSRLFKVFYSFSTDALQEIHAEVSAHYESIRSKDKSTLMSASHALREMLEVEESSQGKTSHTDSNTVPRRHWNKVVNKRRVTSASDAACNFLILASASVIGALILQSVASDWYEIKRIVEVTDTMHTFGMYSSVPVTVFIAGFALDLNLKVNVAQELMKDPKEVLRKEKDTFLVGDINLGSL